MMYRTNFFRVRDTEIFQEYLKSYGVYPEGARDYHGACPGKPEKKGTSSVRDGMVSFTMEGKDNGFTQDLAAFIQNQVTDYNACICITSGQADPFSGARAVVITKDSIQGISLLGAATDLARNALGNDRWKPIIGGNTMETKNEILEKLFTDAGIDWAYSFWKERERNFVEFETSSPAGEDFLMDIYFDLEDPAGSLVENMKEYYQGFDPEEHAEPWIESRGKNGVPNSIQELIDDAHAIDGMIKDLIFALEPKEEGADTAGRTISRDELAEILDARDTLCGYCENDACEKCIVTMLVNDAYNECPDENEDE